MILENLCVENVSTKIIINKYYINHFIFVQVYYEIPKNKMSCRKKCGCNNQCELPLFLFKPNIIPKSKSKTKTSNEIYGDQVYPSDIHLTIGYTARDMIGDQSYDAPQDTPKFIANNLNVSLVTKKDSDPSVHRYIDPKTLIYYQSITSVEKYKNLRTFNLRWQLFDVRKENLNKKKQIYRRFIYE